MQESNRRDFMKAATIGVGAAAVLAEVRPSEAQTMKLNAQAKAVLPNGDILDRAKVLSQLGLDPTTPPDAWLAIVACGSNASALRPEQLKGLVERGKIDRTMLDKKTLQKLR